MFKMITNLKRLLAVSALLVSGATISEAAILDFSAIQGSHGPSLSVTYATLNNLTGDEISVGEDVYEDINSFCFIGTIGCNGDGELIFDTEVFSLKFEIEGADPGDSVEISAYNGFTLLTKSIFTTSGDVDFSAFGPITRMFFDDSSEHAGVGFSNFSFDIEVVSAVPLPATLPLYGAGLAVLGYLGWRRKQRQTAA